MEADADGKTPLCIKDSKGAQDRDKRERERELKCEKGVKNRERKREKKNPIKQR